MSYYTHSVAVAPIEPVEPDEPRPIYPEHRMDFLTMLLDDGTPEFKGYEAYQTQPADWRQRSRAAHVENGMTRYLVGVCQDGLDEIGDPPSFLPILQELHAEGLGPCLAACPEDAPEMQHKYRDVSYFIATLQNALNLWQPWVAEVWLGVEADEVWTPDQILQIAKGIKGYHLPIVLHLGQGHVLPKGTGNYNWWKNAADAGITAFVYQAKHANVEDAGKAFLSNPDTIRQELKNALDAVMGHVAVISSEYAYFGINPSPTTVNHISTQGYVLGEKSLEESGVAGISNGGPGYWPPEPLEPPVGAVDDIDINAVSFFDRSGHAINDIRRWPIESQITPSFPDGGRKVSYAHSATLAWPVWDEDKDGHPDPGGVNANSWLCMFRSNRWEAYTNDYLRPGSSEKVWAEVNSFAHEPITWGPPAHGETLYLFVTRIARTAGSDGFPTGEGRSNLVRVHAP